MELVPENGNGRNALMPPLKVNLDGCGVDVLEARDEDGTVYRQLRFLHLSGAVEFICTLNETSALSIANRLSGSKLTIANAIPKE